MVNGVAAVQGQQVIVDFVSAKVAQLVTLRLTGTDIYGGAASVNFIVGLLWGDADGNGVVNDADLDAVAAAAEEGGAVDGSTLRLDINVSGKVNNADVVQTRKRRTQGEL